MEINTNKLRGLYRHTVDKDFFKEINAEEKAYWLGFLMADGCVYKGASANSYRLQINLAKEDIEILEKFNKALKSSYNITTKTIHNKRENKDYEVVTLKINNTELCNDLMKLNVVPRKSVVAEFPNIPEKYYRDFIRGYFDGDGCVTYTQLDTRRKGKFQIVGGPNILLKFQEIFKKNDIETHYYSINHSKADELMTASIPEIQKIFSYLYKDATVYLDRKYNKFLEFLSPYSATNNEKNSD